MRDNSISWKGSDTASSEFILSKRINKFWKHVPDLKDLSILDYGCGEGKYSSYLSTIAKKVMAVDIDLFKIRKAREVNINNKKNLEFMGLKGNKLMFDDECFDLVFLNEVIEHIVYFDKTFKEITRVLKKSGFCVIYAPNKLYPFEQHGFEIYGKKFGNKFPFITWLPENLTKKYVKFCARQYTFKDLKEIASQYNYSIVYHDYLAPPCDGVQRKNYYIGNILKFLFDSIEKIPILKTFMMSHLMILKKK